MTDIVQKALALLNEVRLERGFAPLVGLYGGVYLEEALMRAIEQLEAFKQEVSDAAEVYEEMGCPMGWEGFEQFIIPAPKPDPLVEIMEQCSTVDAEEGETYEDAMVRNIRAALEARGLEIRSKNDD